MLALMTTSLTVRRNAEEQARLDAALTDLIEHRITFNRVLGLAVQALLPHLVLRFDMRPDLVGHVHYGRLHGGVISAVLDALGGGALMVGLGEKHPHESCEQVMHRFLKIGTIDLGWIFCAPGWAGISLPAPRYCGSAGAWAAPRCSCTTTTACSSPAPLRPTSSVDACGLPADAQVGASVAEMGA